MNGAAGLCLPRDGDSVIVKGAQVLRDARGSCGARVELVWSHTSTRVARVEPHKHTRGP
jgi:hypothetical protein